MGENLLRTHYAQLMFYVRESYWHQAEVLCSSVITSTDDWVFRVWRALCYDRQGMTHEAMREYRAAETRRQTAVPALMGMWLVYKRNQEQAEVDAVELHMQDDKHAKDVNGWTQAAALAWAMGDLNAARNVLTTRLNDNLMMEHHDEYTNLGTIRGWIDLSTGRTALLEKCGSLFQKVMALENEHDNLDINAVIGRVMYLEKKYQFPQAQELLNKLIVCYPNFTPALIVKARLLMHAEDWEQALEVTQRILAKDKSDLEALTLQTLYALIKDARIDAAALYVSQLWESLQRKEPRNAPLLYQLAKALAQLCGGQLSVLNITAKMMETACSLDSHNGDFLCEMGYEHLYRGDTKSALTVFQKSAVLAESLNPLIGSAHAYILMENVEEATKQLSVCNELQSAYPRSAELALLNAIVQGRYRKNEAKAMVFLNQATDIVRQDMENQGNNGLQLYVKLNLPVMLDIARELMQYSRNEPPDPLFQHSDAAAEKCQSHLELLLRYVPACVEAQLLLARVQFVSGKIPEATAAIKRCLQCEQPLSEAYLLSAQVCHYVGNTRLASQSLEQALTIDFGIKDRPLYNLINGMVLSTMGKNTAARDAFLHAMALVKGRSGAEAGAKAKPPVGAALNSSDLATLYIQLAQVYVRLREMEESRKVLSEAAATFLNTTQADRITIAQALLLARTNVDKSLEMLRQIPSTSTFFVQARTQMAKLYMHQRHDLAQYVLCFEEMVKERPSPQGFIELGEAYTNIQEPEKAIAAYQKAKAMDADNSELAVRIGRTMVSTHDYTKAIQYYQDALKVKEDFFSVRADLAMLYWHLGHVDKAVELLQKTASYTQEPRKQEDTSLSIERVNCALLLYRIHRSTGDYMETGKMLLQACHFQQHVLDHQLTRETRETVLQQRSIMAGILTKLSNLYTRGGELTRAKECLHEALSFDDINEPAMLALAQLYLEERNTDACEQQCNALLRIYPSCAGAAAIMAKLYLFRADRFDDAAQFFEQLLAQKPINYEALVQYMDLLRRAGRRESIKEVLDKAINASPATQRVDPGLSYARGMYHYYMNENADALRAFNLARLPTDNPWSNRALEHMISIYLVPTTTDIWVDTTVVEKTENIRCAEQLLLQLPIGEMRQLLQGYCLLATKQPANIEKAMKIFLTLIAQAQHQRSLKGNKNTSTSDSSTKTNTAKTAPRAEANEDDDDDLLLADINQPQAARNTDGTSPHPFAEPTLAMAMQCTYIHCPAFLGLAMALHLSAKDTAASNALHRIFNTATPRQMEKHADIIERARLLMAHILVTNNDFEKASKLLQQVLDFNKSSIGAWNQLGFIYERQGKHAEASEAYQHAWHLSQENDPSIGYRVAFNYLKGNDLVKAIDVCKKALARHASYPCIDKDIMDVAYHFLRP